MTRNLSNIAEIDYRRTSDGGPPPPGGYPNSIEFMKPYLNHLKSIGFSGIELNTNIPIDFTTGNIQNFGTNNGNEVLDLTYPTDIFKVIDYAHQLGLSVDVKFNWVDSNDNGLYKLSNLGPNVSILNLFSNATQYLTDFSKIADSHNLDSICVGGFLFPFEDSKYDALWNNLYSSIRSSFKGQLGYEEGNTFSGNTAAISNADFLYIWVGSQLSTQKVSNLDDFVKLFYQPTIQGSPSLYQNLINIYGQYHKNIIVQCASDAADTGINFLVPHDFSTILKLDYSYQALEFQAIYTFLKSINNLPVDGFLNFEYTPWALSIQQIEKITGNYWTSIESAVSFDPDFNPILEAAYKSAFSAIDDVIQLSEANSSYYGTTNQDKFIISASNITVDGRGGFDQISFPGYAYQYTLSKNSNDNLVSIQDHLGQGGTDKLLNIQLLNFSDITLDTSWINKTAALPHSQIVGLTQLYIASFNRAPDSVGLDYWGGRLSDGMSLNDIAKSFFVQKETIAAYPVGLSTSDFVTKVYNNVLSRGPDTGGLNYWVGQLNNGSVSKDAFLLAIINGAMAASGSAVDRQTLANKEAVGEHYAIYQGLNNSTTWAQDVMSGVTSVASTVTAANAKADHYAVVAANPATSDLVVKLVGVAV